MADDTGKKGWWGSIGKEFLVSLIGDAGVFVLLRSLFKNGVQATGEMITERVKQRVMNDKRAQMMREMRKMEDNGIDLTNLDNRHKKSIDEMREYHFVELLSKVCPAEPGDPAKPAVTPEKGKPQNDWQADILWLNDMSEERFNLKLEWLDHNVVTQWYQIARRQGTKILKKIFDDFKALAITIGAVFGVSAIAITAFLSKCAYGIVNAFANFFDGIGDLITAFFTWLKQSRWNLILVLILAVLLFWTVALPLIVIALLVWKPSALDKAVAALRKLGITIWHVVYFVIGVILCVVTYKHIVPTDADPRLLPALYLLAGLTWHFRKFRWIRFITIPLMVWITILFFGLGGSNPLVEDTKKVWAAVHSNSGKDDDAEAKKKPSAGQPTQNGSPIVIEPLAAPARQNQQPTTGAPQVMPETPPPAIKPLPRTEIMPMSGDEGALRVVMYSAKYVAAGEIDCEGYIQNKDGSDNPLIYLGDSAGVDNRGAGFNVWTFGGSIQFLGGGNSRKLIPGSKNGFVFRFHRPSGITEIAFTLNVIGEDGTSHEYVFDKIPVSVN